MVSSGTYVYKYTWVLWFLLVLMCISIIWVLRFLLVLICISILVCYGFFWYLRVYVYLGDMVSSGTYMYKHTWV